MTKPRCPKSSWLLFRKMSVISPDHECHFPNISPDGFAKYALLRSLNHWPSSPILIVGVVKWFRNIGSVWLDYFIKAIPWNKQKPLVTSLTPTKVLNKWVIHAQKMWQNIILPSVSAQSLLGFRLWLTPKSEVGKIKRRQRNHAQCLKIVPYSLY